MRNPDQFDAFYKDARDRLLLQTYALTGDLPARGRGPRLVRGGLAPLAQGLPPRGPRGVGPPARLVPRAAPPHRPACGTATRAWTRDPVHPRRAGQAAGDPAQVLLLAQLASVSMADMAREVGVTRVEAERQLQTASAQFAVQRGVPTTSIRPLFEALRAHVGEGRWPRASIIRRAGAARRRTHTAVGAVAAVAALVLTGSLVFDAAGVPPTLAPGGREVGDRDDGPGHPPARGRARRPPGHRDAHGPAARPRRAPGQRWRVDDTNDNTDGDGPCCPASRRGTPTRMGTAALLRTFSTAHQKPAARWQGLPGDRGVADDRAARRGPSTGPSAGTPGALVARVQLLSTYRVDRPRRPGEAARAAGLAAGRRP